MTFAATNQLPVLKIKFPFLLLAPRKRQNFNLQSDFLKVATKRMILMKFFEKGKIFGLLNIIDLIIILLILGAIWGVFAKTSLLGRIKQNYVVSPIQVLIIVENVRQYTVDVVKPGDLIKESRSGEQLGVVKEVMVEDYKEKAVWRMSPVP
jgi:hypothetical protein